MSRFLPRVGDHLGSFTRRTARRMGLREEAALLLPAVLIGIIAAAAGVAFHELIVLLRDLLYRDYTSGWALPLLILFPAIGGLLVGLITWYLGERESHGVVDVMESVITTKGFEKPLTAVEKIVTSALTIGSGGSAGAEGPIVQIGAAISALAGRVFGVARHHMPTLVGCGVAAGISAIFNAPIGGVLFTLEVILVDFSVRTFTPVVVAAVIANVTTRTIFDLLASHLEGEHTAKYTAIFGGVTEQPGPGIDVLLDWPQLLNYIALGVACGAVGAALTRLMLLGDKVFHRLPGPRPMRPMVGGLLTGTLGVVLVLAWGGTAAPGLLWPMPAFFGDGYAATQTLLAPGLYGDGPIVWLLVSLVLAKLLATVFTLGSGGSGGVIAPALFLGACVGGTTGTLLRGTGMFANLRPELYALVGMGAALAAVVHAPLASILILFEVTTEYRVVLPAMLACTTALGTAKLLAGDSLYMQGLKRRGVRRRIAGDLDVLRRLSVEQVSLEPASVVQITEPLSRVAELMHDLETSHFIVIDETGGYRGMLLSDDLNAALLEPEALPLLTAAELMRDDIAPLSHTDDLGLALERFISREVSRLPVTMGGESGHVIGLLTRAGLARRLQQES